MDVQKDKGLSWPERHNNGQIYIYKIHFHKSKESSRKKKRTSILNISREIQVDNGQTDGWAFRIID